MGFLTPDSKLAQQAKDAHRAGKPVFIAALRWTPGPRGLGTDSEIADWTSGLAEIESAGWRLDQWSVTREGITSIAHAVFRRS